MCKSQRVVFAPPTSSTGSVVVKGSLPGRYLQRAHTSVTRRKSEELSQNGRALQWFISSIYGGAGLLLAIENPEQISKDDEIDEQQAKPHPGSMPDQFV